MNMRDLMSVLEAAVGTPPNIERAMEIIEEYVTYGEIHNGIHIEHFNALFEELLRLIPRPNHSYTLYRSIRLTDDELAAIANGLPLSGRKFMSWTTDSGVAERIAWDKGRSGHPVIITMTFPASEIVIDVLEFYREHRMVDWESFRTYVRPEKEVVVNHTGAIVLTPHNCKLLERKQIAPPQEGDVAFLPDDEDSYEIMQILDSSSAAQGVFSVLINGMDEQEVRPIVVNGKQAKGEWEII